MWTTMPNKPAVRNTTQSVQSLFPDLSRPMDSRVTLPDSRAKTQPSNLVPSPVRTYPQPATAYADVPALGTCNGSLRDSLQSEARSSFEPVTTKAAATRPDLSRVVGSPAELIFWMGKAGMEVNVAGRMLSTRDGCREAIAVANRYFANASGLDRNASQRVSSASACTGESINGKFYSAHSDHSTRLEWKKKELAQCLVEAGVSHQDILSLLSTTEGTRVACRLVNTWVKSGAQPGALRLHARDSDEGFTTLLSALGEAIACVVIEQSKASIRPSDLVLTLLDEINQEVHQLTAAGPSRETRERLPNLVAKLEALMAELTSSPSVAEREKRTWPTQSVIHLAVVQRWVEAVDCLTDVFQLFRMCWTMASGVRPKASDWLRMGVRCGSEGTSSKDASHSM